MPLLLNFLVPFAFSILKSYMNSPSSKRDDLILQGAKDGVNYLCRKDNNTVNEYLEHAVSSQSMKAV
ncbi:MAG: hypothetical protein Q8R86_09660 [Sulfuricurvum sp.]|nr:hypothetical protein [Sulfuricurvum sp.]